jgi:hypothetical protein
MPYQQDILQQLFGGWLGRDHFGCAHSLKREEFQGWGALFASENARRAVSGPVECGVACSLERA